MQGISLDLGTAVLPFANLRVSTVVDKEFVSPGESLIYTIRIFNHGQSAIRTMQIRLFDTLDPWVDYVPGTTTAAVVDSGMVQNITDDNIGTIFPLDETGLFIPLILPRRGGMVDVSFEVKLKPASVIMMEADAIINTGTMQELNVIYKPNINLSNTVYVGSDSTGSGCSSAVEYVKGGVGADAVYCFLITNSGATYLSNVTLRDDVLAFNKADIKMLAPGESVLVPFKASILSYLTNIATVVGNPVYANGTDITNLADVTATDPSGVGINVSSVAGDPVFVNVTELADGNNPNRTTSSAGGIVSKPWNQIGLVTVVYFLVSIILNAALTI
jgi:uncharacterized repeat protein (TIGR01451 family)